MGHPCATSISTAQVAGRPLMAFGGGTMLPIWFERLAFFSILQRRERLIRATSRCLNSMTSFGERTKTETHKIDGPRWAAQMACPIIARYRWAQSFTPGRLMPLTANGATFGSPAVRTRPAILNADFHCQDVPSAQHYAVAEFAIHRRAADTLMVSSFALWLRASQ